MKHTKKVSARIARLGMLLLTVVMMSCNKDDLLPKSDYYVKFKIDGKERVMDGTVMARQLPSPTVEGVYMLMIHAFADDIGIDDELFALWINTDSPVTSPGVFHAVDQVPSYPELGSASLAWLEAGGVMHAVNGPAAMIDMYEEGLGIRPSLKVRITSINGQEVRGTFEAVSASGLVDGDSFFRAAITQGEFKVPLVPNF